MLVLIVREVPQLFVCCRSCLAIVNVEIASFYFRNVMLAIDVANHVAGRSWFTITPSCGERGLDEICSLATRTTPELLPG